MKLGPYTFDWTPELFTIPKYDKFYSAVRTYSSMHYFSWGIDVVGKPVFLNWDWMKEIDFLNLQKLLEDDEQKTWDLEAEDRLYHGTVVNGPFVVGKSIAGVGGAVGVISAVNILDNYVVFSAVTGNFVHGEAIVDDSFVQKTSTVTGVNIYPNYTVEVLELNGIYHENLTTNFIYRSNIELKLMIMAVL